MSIETLETRGKLLLNMTRDSAVFDTTKAQSKANPYLPCEILHQIWRHVLCPHGGINLHIDKNWIPALLKRGLVPTQAHFDSRPSSPTATRDEDGQSDSSGDCQDLDLGADDGYQRALRSQAGIEVTILRLNHGIYEECLPLLYGRNRFTFHTDPLTMAFWLTARSTRQIGLIRHLGFPKRLVVRGEKMQALYDLIAHRMQVETVTMWYLRDEDPEAVYEEGEYERQSPDWYKCAMDFRTLLQDEKIGQLRLLFALDEYKSRRRQVFNFLHLYYEPVFLPKDIDLNSIGVVNKLNRTPDAHTLEPIAYAVFETAHEELPISAYTACSGRFEKYIKALRSGNVRALNVSREDCCGIDEGTVFVLRTSFRADYDFICQDRPKWLGRHRNNDASGRF